MANISYILGNDSITVILDANSYTINAQAHTYDLVLAAVRANDVEALRKAVNVREGINAALTAQSSGAVRIVGTQIFAGDREITGLVASRIFDIIRLGLDVNPMLRFVENLLLNPSKRAVDELFSFLSACDLPITQDGCFLAYKRVRDDYYDLHSGTMNNSVGSILTMPRNLVDEDKNRTCSTGLHFCSYDYLEHFSGPRIVVLKINPRDVVAIPADYNNSKGRTCRYEVVDELPLNEYQMPDRKIVKNYTAEYNDNQTSSESKSDPVSAAANVNTTGKLTPSDVISIRYHLRSGKLSLAAIARKYGVHARTIARIRDGEAWSNIG